MSAATAVAIIDDDPGSRRAMAETLHSLGPVVEFDDAARALEHIAEHPEVSVAVCDVVMPGMDGAAFLQEVRRRKLDVAVILVTAYSSIAERVLAESDDYLEKPVDRDRLRKRVTICRERKRLESEVVQLQERLDKRYGFERIIGHSESMERLFDRMRTVAPTKTTVLVVGESGTGKELVANALHQNSPRRARRFVPINCGAIPRDILESELFGHEKGAFTGALARKIGKIELAQGGTLFLDEISELSPELQVKLLRVLEDHRIMRVGGTELIDVDFRLIAATNRKLEREVQAGRFRSDLYFRLKVVTLEIPALRDRPEDLPLPVRHYLDLFAEEHGRAKRELSLAALKALQQAPWPGNIRELKNVLENLVLFGDSPRIDVADLPDDVLRPAASAAPGRPDAPPVAAVRPMAEIERDAIFAALRQTHGRRGEAARLLDIGLRTLQRKLKEYRAEGAAREFPDDDEKREEA
ncbi:MAG TPA: sigma-54 dependent transcriptional regulator [Thermoanaerobaculia bacterium]|nr:sigma-54 dependent transcriptional regulator [Thermoanaerobaculia bacterium]